MRESPAEPGGREQGSPAPGATAQAAVIEYAPAKVNLCLHVTGRRADGYHELDSLVAFATIGDTVRVAPAEDGAFLQVSCREMPVGDGGDTVVVPTGTGNLAWHAMAVAARANGGTRGLTVTLDKRLPAGAGLGGGSSDAAAVIRAVMALPISSQRGSTLPGATGDGLKAAALALGADIPMCLDPRPWRAGGIGEILTPVTIARDLPAVLVWPGRPVATPAVFRARAGEFGAPVPDAALQGLATNPIAALAGLRNDLTAAACRVEPAIRSALNAVGRLPGCRLARMSGSGSTVFGLFDSAALAAEAARLLAAARPGWWVRHAMLRAGRVETRVTPPDEPALPG